MIVALLLGVVTTFVFAWPIGVWRHAEWQRNNLSRTFGAHHDREGRAYLTERNRGTCFDEFIVRITYIRPPLSDGEPLPGWVAIPADRAPPTGWEMRFVETIATGWPWRAMAYERWMDAYVILKPPSPNPYIHYTFPRPRESHTNAWLTPDSRFGSFRVPLRPIWPGLLADAVLFAVPWWSLFTLAAWWRIRRRRRAGLCANCGYARAGLTENTPCPECAATARIA